MHSYMHCCLIVSQQPLPLDPLPTPLAGVCAGGGSSEEYSDVEDAGSHTEVVYVKARALAARVWAGGLGC